MSSSKAGDPAKELEVYIRQKVAWPQLPANVRAQCADNVHEWEAHVLSYSLNHQLRWRSNVVRYACRDERQYYARLVRVSRERLMLYPYHLSDILVKGLRLTPFTYYLNIVHDIMTAERSYDTLPNFTAADCVRLLGIGRNQYIDIMNTSRAKGWSWRSLGSASNKRRSTVRQLLPSQPMEAPIEPWWCIMVGFVSEDDARASTPEERLVLDRLIDAAKPIPAGLLDYGVVRSLYTRGLVYLDVPVDDDDFIQVPPLENFVMNRVLGDYFEKLLYKIFVSMDEKTSVADLSSVLQEDRQLIKNAISMYLRLGFARKKKKSVAEGGGEENGNVHESWKAYRQARESQTVLMGESLLPRVLHESSRETDASGGGTGSTGGSVLSGGGVMGLEGAEGVVETHSQRIAFLFDSTLTAFLMMGNLSPGLKNHAVTMFEVGKLSDESLDAFLRELNKVDAAAANDSEGDAQRYFDHALALRDTLNFLRFNKKFNPSEESDDEKGYNIDLLRCESLNALDTATCNRLLARNYCLLVSMAPLSPEIRPLSSCAPPHIGPPIAEASSPWFKLWLYATSGSGPPSYLFPIGTRLRRLPSSLVQSDYYLLCSFNHEPTLVAHSNMLIFLNEALVLAPVLLQAYCADDAELLHVSLPLHSIGSPPTTAPAASEALIDLSSDTTTTTVLNGTAAEPVFTRDSPHLHKGIARLSQSTQQLLSVSCGVISLVPSSHNSDCGYELFDLSIGIPLFDASVNRDVCDKIISHRLFDRSSLEKYTTNSRRLVVALLSFVAAHTDDSIGSACDSPRLPHPTRPLSFVNGTLSTFTP